MNDAEFWKLMAMIAGGMIIPLLGIAWRSLTKRVEEVRGIALAALTKDEFERELKQSLRDRARLDRAVTELYAKVDATREAMGNRLEAARTNMIEEMGQLRTEMTAGFNSIRDLLIARSR